MGLIPAAHRADLVRNAERSFDQTATIERSVSTRTAGGGFTTTWSTVAANVPCSLATSPRFRDEQVTADRRINATLLSVRFPYSTNILAGDQLTIAGLLYIVDDAPPVGSNALTRSVLVKAK